MAKRKLERFAENETFRHLFQPKWEELQQGFDLRGKWASSFFGNNHPLTLELGCGKGEYTVSLARKYPMKNFIGLDKKGARMWRGAKTTNEGEMKNVAFIRGLAENLPLFFAEGEIDEIWITFPEPQPNSPRTKKRFTSPQFLDRFAKIMSKEGIIHLKTDNDSFYQYTFDIIKEHKFQLLYSTNDLYQDLNDPEIADVIAVRTYYESIWLEQGLKIKYLKFRL